MPALAIPRRSLSPALLTAGLAALAGLVALAAGLALRGASAPGGPERLVTVGARTLAVPSGSPAESRGPRAPGRLDLLLSWPDLGPPRLAVRDARGRPVAAPMASNVTLAIRAADDTLDPAERAVHLHGRFLEGDVWSNPGGLVMRRFRPGTPFEGEELFISAPDGRVFAARCPVPARTTVSDRCLAVMRVSGFDLEVSFDRSLLNDWERLAGGVRRFLAGALR